jgi:uncharacterized membrane protein YeaQ/YmgE (transglycosylase-associated protein family)
MLHIIWYIIVGFIIGLIARAIMPGAQHLGLILTTLLGIGGSIIGGLIARLFSKPEPGSTFHPAGFIMSIIGAIILLFIWVKLVAPYRRRSSQSESFSCFCLVYPPACFDNFCSVRRMLSVLRKTMLTEVRNYGITRFNTRCG